MKIVLAGGSGFIGTPLRQALLADGHEVILLTRHPETSPEKVNDLQTIAWDAKTVGSWTKLVDGADAVINLAGEPIAARRWSSKQRERISHSRIYATRALVDAIGGAIVKPKVLINASAVGYYGNVPSGEVTEVTPAGDDFLATICTQWEAEAQFAVYLGLRVVKLRTGIVLGTGGGALQKMLPAFRLFVGAPLGSGGKQWFPWIHLQDVVAAIRFALTQDDLAGALNLTAPNPVTMKEFSQALAKMLHRPCWPPIPTVVLETLLGQLAHLMVRGQKAIPQRLTEAGFSFKFPELSAALSNILS